MRRTVGILLLAAAFLCGGQTSARAYGFTLTPLSPLTQSWPEIDFLGPYFYFLLTNTASTSDDFHLEISNLTPPDWFPQVCLRQTCYPDSATLAFAPFASDTVGVNIVPLYDGVGNADFTVTSMGNPALHTTFHVTLYAGTAAVDVKVSPSVATLRLAQSAPNPSSGPARIEFVLPREDRATLRVYDAAGRLLETLVDDSMAAGAHFVTWQGRSANGSPLPAGAYFYRLETSQGSLSRRLILVR